MKRPFQRILIVSVAVMLFWGAVFHFISKEHDSWETSDTGVLCYTNGFCINFFNQNECYKKYNEMSHARIVPWKRTESELESQDDAQLAQLNAEYIQRAQSNADTLIRDLEDARSLVAEDRAEACVEAALQQRARSFTAKKLNRGVV